MSDQSCYKSNGFEQHEANEQRRRNELKGCLSYYQITYISHMLEYFYQRMAGRKRFQHTEGVNASEVCRSGAPC